MPRARSSPSPELDLRPLEPRMLLSAGPEEAALKEAGGLWPAPSADVPRAAPPLPAPAPLGAPTDLKAVGVSFSRIDLQWVDNATEEGADVGFEIERADGGGAFVPVGTRPANATTYTDTGLQTGRKYTYRVRAVNGALASAYATSAETQTLSPALTTRVKQLPALLDASTYNSAEPSAVVEVNGWGYFLASNKAVGHIEFWKTDGTKAGTALVKDLGGGLMGRLAVSRGKVFFTHTDTVGSTYLWSSDGTADGTAAFRYLFPIDLRLTPRARVGEMQDVNGLLWITVLQPFEYDGGRVCRSDGTAAGTVFVKDFAHGWPKDLTGYGGATYFQVDGARYKTDGTTAGTGPTQDYVPGFGRPLRAVLGGTVYYIAAADGGGQALYAGGATAGSDVPLLALADPTGIGAAWLREVGGRLFYVTYDWADAGQTRRVAELWRHDGVAGPGVSLGRVPFEGTAGITALADDGERAYFAVQGTAGQELWRVNVRGSGGLARVSTFADGAIERAGTVSGRVTFSGGAPAQLWASDGTDPGTVQLTDIGAIYRAPHPDFLTPVGEDLYFVSSALVESVQAERAGGRELWKTDGKPGGSVKLHTGVYVRDLMEVNGTLYFVDEEGIWKTDGTAAGTVLACATPGARLVGSLGDTLFFGWGSTLWGGRELYKLPPGTTAPVRMGTASVYVEFRADPPRPAAAFGRWLYFFDAWNYGRMYAGGLWRTDGTVVEQVEGVSEGEWLVKVGDTLYFVARPTGRFAFSLFKIAGDAASPAPTLVRDIFDWVNHPMPLEGLTAVGDKVYFSAQDGDRGMNWWRSDGTAAGTFVVVDPVSGDFPMSAGRVYMAADVGGVGYGISSDFYNAGPGPVGWLWRTDGTAAGSRKVRAVSVPEVMPFGARPLFMTAAGGWLVYSDAEYLWRSDGTVEGTVQIDRIGTAPDGSNSPAVFGSSPYAVIGDRVYYSAAVNGGGRELRVAYLDKPKAPGALAVGIADSWAGTPGTSGAGPSAGPTAPRVSLTWADNSANESGFLIERSGSPSFATIDASFFVEADTTSFVDPSAGVGDRTFYRVRAINAGGESAASNPAAAGAPTVRAAVADDDSAAHRVVLRFDGDVEASLAAADLAVTNLTTGQVVPADALVLSYDRADQSLTVGFGGGAWPDGRYRLLARSGEVVGATGLALDGDGDGAPGGDYRLDFFRLAGDVDRDGAVGFADLLVVSQNYDKAAATPSQGDLNGDGTVGFADLLLVAQKYDGALPAAAPAVSPLTASAAPLAAATAAEIGASSALVRAVPAARNDMADGPERPRRVFSAAPVSRVAVRKVAPVSRRRAASARR